MIVSGIEWCLKKLQQCCCDADEEELNKRSIGCNSSKLPPPGGVIASHPPGGVVASQPVGEKCEPYPVKYGNPNANGAPRQPYPVKVYGYGAKRDPYPPRIGG